MIVSDLLDEVPSTEHGDDHTVPLALAAAEGVVDISYRNDESPCFGIPIATDPDPAHVRIWVQHPDDDQRGFPGTPRYLVDVSDLDTMLDLWSAVAPEADLPANGDYEYVAETDDPFDALRTALTWAIRLRPLVANHQKENRHP